MKITSNAQLTEAIRIAFCGLCASSNRWTVASAKEFMRCEALEKSVQLNTIQAAVHLRDGGAVLSTDELRELAPIPASMQSPDIDIFIFFSAIMHHLPLGVDKATYVDILIPWLKSHRKSTAWIVHTNNKLQNVHRLRLTWLKVETIMETTSKFGKYVSENYLSLTRCTPWLIADIEDYEASDPIYTDPN